MTFDKDHNNIKTVTAIAGNSCRETKTISYYRQFPEQIVVSKSGSAEIQTTNIDYDEYGNIIRIKDHEGRWTENKYELKSQPARWSEFLVQSSGRERVKTGTENSYVSTIHTFDSYGNTLSAKVTEYTGSYAQITENILPQAISINKYIPWFIHLPEGASGVEIDVSGYYEAEVKCWAEGSEKELPKEPPVSYGVDKYILDPAKQYIVEIAVFPSGVINAVNVTYNKLILTEGPVKETTYCHYASPSTFGQPDEVHREYGSGGAQHSTGFGADSCIVTRYEYLSAAVDNPVTGENYANLFPTKIIRNVINADQQPVQEISEMRYSRFGNVTQIKKGTLTNQYEYDGLNRLKAEICQSDSVPGEALRKEYFYAASPDARGYYYTEISHQDEAGNGAANHITRYYYNASGQHVETRKGLQGSSVIEKVRYDIFGRKAQAEDGIGVKTMYEYDGYGRPKKVELIDKTGVLTGYTSYVYNDAGRPAG